jgi:hypothetical protein
MTYPPRWLVLVAAACSSPEGSSGPAGPAEPGSPVDLGGQTGSPIGQTDCTSDADCAAKAERLVSGLAPGSTIDWVLSRSVCLPSDGSTRTQTTCHCYDDRKNGGLLLGVRPGCDEVDRFGRCLLPPSAFTGCDLAQPDTSCQAACQDLVDRWLAAYAAPAEMRVRYAVCDAHVCDLVLEVDGRCYTSFTGESYDCSLTDQAILEQERQRLGGGLTTGLCWVDPDGGIATCTTDAALEPGDSG